MNARIELEQHQVQLLDQALRLAYTRLVESGAALGSQFYQVRDLLAATIVIAMLRGETEPWRLARRGLFAACDAIAFGKDIEPDRPRTAAA